MKHLLDSHTLLWYSLGSSQLSRAAEAAIRSAGNTILMSPASYWEIAIKVSLGKLKLNQKFEDFLEACVNRYRFTILPIEPKHAAALIGLTHHHKDPFDRMLVAQSLTEQIPIISDDALLDQYGVKRVW